MGWKTVKVSQGRAGGGSRYQVPKGNKKIRFTIDADAVSKSALQVGDSVECVLGTEEHKAFFGIRGKGGSCFSRKLAVSGKSGALSVVFPYQGDLIGCFPANGNNAATLVLSEAAKNAVVFERPPSER